MWVGLGSHASYYRENEHGRYKEYTGSAEIYYEKSVDVSGISIPKTSYTCEILLGQPWLKYKGSWGADSKGPNGPVFRRSANVFGANPRASMWIDPFYWLDDLVTYPGNWWDDWD